MFKLAGSYLQFLGATLDKISSYMRVSQKNVLIPPNYSLGLTTGDNIWTISIP